MSFGLSIRGDKFEIFNSNENPYIFREVVTATKRRSFMGRTWHEYSGFLGLSVDTIAAAILNQGDSVWWSLYKRGNLDFPSTVPSGHDVVIRALFPWNPSPPDTTSFIIYDRSPPQMDVTHAYGARVYSDTGQLTFSSEHPLLMIQAQHHVTVKASNGSYPEVYIGTYANCALYVNFLNREGGTADIFSFLVKITRRGDSYYAQCVSNMDYNVYYARDFRLSCLFIPLPSGAT